MRELLARIDSRELTEWSVYFGLNPWGEERADLRAGVISSTVANSLSEKGGFKPSDFMPRYGPQPEEKPKSMGELKSAAMAMAAMFKGPRR